jgi:biotin transport system substrate-specific component
MTIALPRLDRAHPDERGLTLADFLVPVRIADRLSPRVRHVTLIGLGALFIYLTALVYIAREPVPLTGQTFGVLTVGAALGFRRGGAAVLLYLLIGLVGLPFFAEGKGGVAVLAGGTGGYLIGFVIAGAIVGRLAELGWDRRILGSLGAMLIGSVIIYAIGLPWLMVTGGFTVQQTLAYGLTPFILWDLAKLAVAGALFPLGWWLVERRPDDR